MVAVRISQFKAPTIDQDTKSKLLEQLKHAQDPSTFAIGTQIQDPSIVQLTSQGEGTETVQVAQGVLGDPFDTFVANLNRPVFGDSTARAKAPVMEFVQQIFSVSKVTPEFEKIFADDFERFFETFDRTALPNMGNSHGWSEEVDRAEIKGEKAKTFVVLIGWDQHSDFVESVSRDGFKEGLPILTAHNGVGKLVSTLVSGW